MKSIAEKNNCSLTFMSKPYSDKLGSSSHIHLSLHDLSGKNVFPGDKNKLNSEISCSDNMLYFLGGLMKYSLDTFIFFAPTINSYRRFRNFSWAPTNLDSWSVDNRTSPYRVCGNGKSLRVEFRIPGGDINQYLGYTALISAVNFYFLSFNFLGLRRD